MSFLSIQPSFDEVLADVQTGNVSEEEFWINFIPAGDVEDAQAVEELVKVSKTGDDGQLEFNNSNGLSFSKKAEGQFSISYKGTDFTVRVPKEKVTIDSKGPSTNASFDVSPQHDLFMIGTDSGDLRIGNITDGKIVNTIENAHYSSILRSMFFPSGKVGLTVGLDYQIKIWDITDGTCPRYFLGHRERITDVAMIERGRNFLSSSKDGTVKLWDCASGSNISTFNRKNSLHDGVNALLISNGDSSQADINNPGEFGTLGKQAFAGHESGVVSIFDLSAKRQVSNLASLHSGVTSLSKYEDNSIIAGYNNGVIAIWDKRNNETPLHQINTEAEINNVQVNSEGAIFISYGHRYITHLGKFPSETDKSLNDLLVGFDNDGHIHMKLQEHSTSDVLYVLNNSDTIYEYAI